MPELPEVETVKRGLAPAMEGACFQKVTLNRPNLRFPFPDRFVERLQGARVESVSRRAKFLVLHTDRDDVLIMHLGMSGSFHVQDKFESEHLPREAHHERDRLPAHDHVVFHMQNEAGNCQVIYNDPRRFGFMDLVTRDQFATSKHMAGLGVEPTGNSLDGKCIANLFKNKKAPLKSVLLDQKLIAGLGNIYVCEALWQSGLSPKRIAKSICSRHPASVQRATALAEAIRDVIARAIDAGGSSLNDHRQTDGTLGYFQHSFNVYDREGETCNKTGCTGIIKRMVQSGRSSYYCTRCQK